MTVAQRDEIARNMQQKTTEELLAILVGNDQEQWSDAAFDAIRQTLRGRGVEAISRTLSERPCLGEEPTSDQLIMEPVPRYKGVRGWLLLFCISLTVFNPLSIIASLGAASTSDMFHDFRLAFMADEILSFIFAGLFIYVGACLWRVRSGAVKKAKVFLWCVVALNAILVVLTLMVSLPSHDDRAKAIASAIAALAWLAYLDSSKRVKATYDL
jgi:hypothetical protein